MVRSFFFVFQKKNGEDNVKDRIVKKTILGDRFSH